MTSKPVPVAAGKSDVVRAAPGERITDYQKKKDEARKAAESAMFEQQGEARFKSLARAAELYASLAGMARAIAARKVREEKPHEEAKWRNNAEHNANYSRELHKAATHGRPGALAPVETPAETLKAEGSA